MQKFKIIHIINKSNLNKENKRLWDHVNSLEERIANLESAAVHCEAETVADEDTQAMIIEEAHKTEDEKFDWVECEDAAKLKWYAKTFLKLEIKGNKKAETIKAEIADHLAKEGE